jgi:serine/threonine protein phosphatase PrpC
MPAPSEQVAAGAPAPRSENGSAARCQACGSGPISADGYCEACGRKAPSARDHSETDLGLVAGVTDRGLRHYRNEDAMALAAAETPGGTIVIAVVCDGVSGSTRADEASAAATKAAIGVLVPAMRAGQDAATASLQAVQAAQVAVAGLVGPPGQTAPQDAPSATFVSAVLSAESVTVCSLGDSRAYWLDATATSAAKQLSTDDSVVAQLVTAGLLSEAAALDAPQAHVVTGWLGADVSDTEPHIVTFAPPGPGVVLLCSDGLWNYEPEAARLAERVLPAALTSPLAAARTLADFALQAGGHDNITVVLAPLPLLRPAADPVPFSGDVPAEGSAPTRGQGDDDE